MQIINNIEIICSDCGHHVPVEINVGREPDANRWIFRVMPCDHCFPEGYSASQPKNAGDKAGRGRCDHIAEDGHFCTQVGDVVQ